MKTLFCMSLFQIGFPPGGLPSGRRPETRPGPALRVTRKREFLLALFTKHFCDDKNQDRSAQSSSEEEINQGITNGGEHGVKN
jgi:hypothetical protein